jgi:multiple antibiotic resistance protein
LRKRPIAVEWYNLAMSNLINSFVMTFIPLFIVINAFDKIPVIISLSEDMSKRERFKMINTATITAAIVGLVFLFFGQFILNAMGISIGSFAIAGGIILLVLAIRYMISGRMLDVVKEEMVAIVPIGTPLTVGPGTMTTLLLLSTQFPLWVVLVSLALNIAIAWVVFLSSDPIIKFMGQGGIKAMSKVFSLLLAAIAVNMMVKGLSLCGIVKLPSL